MGHEYRTILKRSIIMININLAAEIAKVQKQFWEGMNKISAFTSAENERNNTCYSWQVYFMNNGRTANWDIFPETTNAMLAAWVAKDESSVFFPDEEEVDEFMSILNYATSL